MIFYILTLIVVLCTSYFFIVACKIDNLINAVNADLSITDKEDLDEEQKTNPPKSLQKLVKYILYGHTLRGWGHKVFFYVSGFVLYVILPLLGKNLLGFQTDEALGEFFFSLEDGDFLIRNATVYTEIRVWAITSIVYLGGIVISLSVSIRKLRRRFCTFLQRSENNQ